MTEKKNVWLVILAAICIIYIYARFWNLTDSCLWFDEIFSIHAAEMDFYNLIRFVAQDLIHPPLFYILLKIWIFIGGESLFWLRFFPILFSIIAFIPFYLICRKLKLDYPAIALALTFFASNGALIKYAQEIRMYSVLLCLALFSIWLFLRFFTLGKSFTVLTIINVFLIYTHYFGWLIIFSEVLAILILQRIKIRQILLSFGVCLLAFAPWIFTIWRAAQINADVNQNLGWADKPDFSTLFQFVFDLFEPFYFQASSIDASAIFLISAPLFLLIVAAYIFYFGYWSGETEDEKTLFYLLIIFIATPVTIAFLTSWILPFSVWGTRHLIVVFAPFLILTAFVIVKIKNDFFKIVLILMVVSLALLAFVLQLNRPPQTFIWCAWEKFAQNLDKNQPVTIYVFEDLVAYHFWFAVRESDQIQIVRVKNIPEMIEDKAYFLPRGFDNVNLINFDEISEPNFYVAFRAANFSENHPPLRNLREKGYQIGKPKIIEAQGLTAILVEIKK